MRTGLINLAFNPIASTPLPGVDITFKRSKFDPAITNRPQMPSRVKYNTCFDGTDPHSDDSGFFAYSLAVHETGHALGLSRFAFFELFTERDSYEMAHPTTPDAAMNFDSQVDEIDIEPDCSPHPFDIMAIYALYQTADFTPSTPRDLSASATSSTVSLGWNPPERGEIAGYCIFRRMHPYPFLEEYVENTGTPATWYVDRGVEPNTTYSYAVKAIAKKRSLIGNLTLSVEVATGTAP